MQPSVYWAHRNSQHVPSAHAQHTASQGAGHNNHAAWERQWSGSASLLHDALLQVYLAALLRAFCVMNHTKVVSTYDGYVRMQHMFVCIIASFLNSQTQAVVQNLLNVSTAKARQARKAASSVSLCIALLRTHEG